MPLERTKKIFFRICHCYVIRTLNSFNISFKPSVLSKSNLIFRIRLKRTAGRRNINLKACVQQEIGKLQGLTSPSGVDRSTEMKKTIYIYINLFVSYGTVKRGYQFKKQLTRYSDVMRIKGNGRGGGERGCCCSL